VYIFNTKFNLNPFNSFGVGQEKGQIDLHISRSVMCLVQYNVKVYQ